MNRVANVVVYHYIASIPHGTSFDSAYSAIGDRFFTAATGSFGPPVSPLPRASILLNGITLTDVDIAETPTPLQPLATLHPIRFNFLCEFLCLHRYGVQRPLTEYACSSILSLEASVPLASYPSTLRDYPLTEVLLLAHPLVLPNVVKVPPLSTRTVSFTTYCISGWKSKAPQNKAAIGETGSRRIQFHLIRYCLAPPLQPRLNIGRASFIFLCAAGGTLADFVGTYGLLAFSVSSSEVADQTFHKSFLMVCHAKFGT
ncbi:uncharacterized protein EI90DRAFT_3011617 [Cantharellus anzutake]|uniref:uncharacterized protein n=1 Tax=Cantharellus anzutake TaxID=1750568 RepID=UPI001903BBDB|nr:uncharacterized protein EI90DRAFT_3011617 [Cantharellus anzutake]KAF8342058.1 hypothetical protein EI90DRAFT_3011617 [Cantharellus anzutake]